MQLKGINIDGTLRLTQANDALDLEFDISTGAGAAIDPSFYSLMFFDLLNGDVTGVDGTPTTGIKFAMYDTDNVLIHESNVAKLDWYETESAYVSEAVPTSTETIAADVRIRRVEVVMVTNESDVAKETVIFSSTTLASSTFATADGNGVKGVLIQSANGNLTETLTNQFVISL